MRAVALSILTAASMCLLAPSAHAQSSDPAWLDALNFQLLTREACDIGFYIRTREYKLAGKMVYEARAQCLDGRVFDASRTSPEPEFTLSLCEIQTC